MRGATNWSPTRCNKSGSLTTPLAGAAAYPFVNGGAGLLSAASRASDWLVSIVGLSGVVSWLSWRGELIALFVDNNFHLLFFLTLILGCL